MRSRIPFLRMLDRICIYWSKALLDHCPMIMTVSVYTLYRNISVENLTGLNGCPLLCVGIQDIPLLRRM